LIIGSILLIQFYKILFLLYYILFLFIRIINNTRYVILDLFGKGTFGQVVKCKNLQTGENVALKVIKNKPAYLNQSKIEVTILDMVSKLFFNHQY